MTGLTSINEIACARIAPGSIIHTDLGLGLSRSFGECGYRKRPGASRTTTQNGETL